MITPNTPNNLGKKLESILKQLNTDEKTRLLKMLQQDKENSENEQWRKRKESELFWNKEAILKNLKENTVILKNVQMYWYNWNKVHINLPAVWNFEWFKFDYFVSYKGTLKPLEYESYPKLEEKLYSMKEIWELLKAMNKYMKEMGVETDGDVDYENDLKNWETSNYRCNAWDCLKDILWLNECYWLKDNNVNWRTDFRALWNCEGRCCYFDDIGANHIRANLFLKLSD